MREIGDYNEVDCRVMMEIIAYLQKQTGALPLRGQPGPIPQPGFVGGDGDAGAVEMSQDLLYKRRLTYLARAGHHLQESPWFREAGSQ
jgi:hypothetical protein